MAADRALRCACLLLLGSAGCAGLQAERLIERVIANNPAAFAASHRQVIVASNGRPEAVALTLQAFERSGDRWEPVTEPRPANGARNGFAPFGEKREGDARAPTGIFRIERSFGYRPAIETAMPYTQVTERDFWIDDTASDDYNRWVRRDPDPEVSFERLKRPDPLYEYGIVVEYNVDPIVKGSGSAIFLHVERGPGAPTVGCISTRAEHLRELLRWLDPAKQPLIVMGTESELASAALH